MSHLVPPNHGLLDIVTSLHQRKICMPFSNYRWPTGLHCLILSLSDFVSPTGRNSVVLSGLESGRHIVEISPLGCSGGSKTLSVKFSV